MNISLKTAISQGDDPKWKWLRDLIGIAVLIAMLCLLFSCSASWHVRRAQKKDPSIFNTQTTSITTIDTLYIETPVVQFRDSVLYDTLVEFKQGETIIRYKIVDKIIHVEADCPDEKVVVEHTETTTETTIVTEKKWIDRIKEDFWAMAGGALLILILFCLPLLLRKRS